MIEIPERLRRRPMFAGMVIPHGTAILSDGKPDFTTNDESKRIEILRKGLCAICGEALDYWMFFIGGDKSYHSRAFIDPAMHEDCARYSIAVCPFLRNQLAQYKEHTRSMSDTNIKTSRYSGMDNNRPVRMGLFMTRGYDVKRSGNALVALAKAFKSAEWF